MPHRRNVIKLTGDTHPPEVADDLYEDDFDEELRSGYEARPVMASGREAPSAMQAVSEQARDEVRRQPLLAMGLALAAGFVLMKLLRR